MTRQEKPMEIRKSPEYVNRKRYFNSNRIRLVSLPQNAFSDIKMPTILKLANYGTLSLELKRALSK